MFKNLITLEDFQNTTVNDKLIENFDYFSANLVCLFIRKLDLNLYLKNLDLEQVISKYDIEINIHSILNSYNNKLDTDYQMTVDILSVDGQPLSNISFDNGIPVDYGLHEIAQSLTSYAHLLSSVTKTEFNKKIKLDLYNAYDIYQKLNDKFEFNKQIEDDKLFDSIANAHQSVFEFQNLFLTKIYLLLLNEFGNDLHINFKNKNIFQIKNHMAEHPNKKNIKNNKFYQLAETLAFRLGENYECSLSSVDHNIENKLNNNFAEDLIIFKNSIEKQVLNNILISPSVFNSNKKRI